MYAVTSQYKEDIKKPYREWDFKATFTYKNSNGPVVRELTQYDVVVSSVKLESGCIPGSVFEFGANISKKFSLTIKNENEEYNNSTINGGTIKPYVGLKLSTGAVEWIPLGTFYIYKVSKPLKTIKIEASDFMTKFEKKYTTGLTFPTTLKSIVDEICSLTGIALDSDFNNSSYTVNDYRQGDALYSYREILKYIAVVSGGYATITRENKLKIATFNLSSSPYLVDPDVMRISSEYEDIKKFTGLLYRKSGNNKMYGTDETPIIIQNNIILDNMSDGDKNNILEGLYNKFNAFSYIPCNVEMRCDPSLDEGDTVSFNKTTDGTVISFIGEYSFTLAGKYKIKSPGTSELDSDFLINKYDTENQKNTGGGGSAAPVVNPNLLLISQFTKAFLPYSFIGKWSYTNYNTYGVECLDSYLMCTGTPLNRIWLPFKGDIKPGQTYTLSLLIKSRDKRKTPRYKVCLVPSHTMETATKIILNDVANKTKTPDGNSTGTTVLGEIQLTQGWDWQTLTFKAPDDLPYQEVTGDIVGTRGYMLALYAYQDGLYTTSTYSNYAAHLHRAKLEEGSVSTAWCYSEAENAAIHETYDDFGRTTNTISSVVNSQVAVYGENQLEIGPTTIHYTETSKVMLMRQKRVGNDITNQILMGTMNLNSANDSLEPSNFISIYNDKSDKSLHISAPGGFYINGTLQE